MLKVVNSLEYFKYKFWTSFESCYSVPFVRKRETKKEKFSIFITSLRDLFQSYIYSLHKVGNSYANFHIDKLYTQTYT